jgi:hypothetical protein
VQKSIMPDRLELFIGENICVLYELMFNNQMLVAIFGRCKTLKLRETPKDHFTTHYSKDFWGTWLIAIPNSNKK